ncbi:MAG: FliH/SctL family protein [Thermodesulfovibrio sp.]|nr:FliH/SctL family protein [Thermodesulfovibrio sp.]MDW7972812.1 FliH/SctL family protein [Thermodesulfovibrio sp.]
MLSSEIKPYIPLSFDEDKRVTIDKKENKLKEDYIKKGYEEGFNKGYKEGYEKGYNEGFKKGYDEGYSKSQGEIKEKSEELFKTTQFFKELIRELSIFKERQIESFLPQILNFAIKIAEKIVAIKVSLDKEVVLSIVKETIKSIPFSEEKVIIKLNPEDYNFISEKINELGIDSKKLQLEPSSEITKGGCIIETQSNHIVSTVEQRFKEIENALYSVLSKQS